MSFPSGSVDINLLQAAQLDFAFSRQLAGLVSESLQLGSSERDARNLSCLLYGFHESGQFQGLPEAFFELFTFWMEEVSYRMECYSLGENLCNRCHMILDHI